MKGTPVLVIHVDPAVPVVKLLRALASHGLVLTVDREGVTTLHEGPGVSAAEAAVQSEAPTVSVKSAAFFFEKWWKR